MSIMQLSTENWDHSVPLRDNALSEAKTDPGVDTKSKEFKNLSSKKEAELTKMLNEAKQELDEASRNKLLYDGSKNSNLLFAKSEGGTIGPQHENAVIKLQKAAIKVITIEKALEIAQKRFDDLYDEATKTNQLIDYILQNPDNGEISPNVTSPQKISDILDSLDRGLVRDKELIQKLVAQQQKRESDKELLKKYIRPRSIR